MGSSYWNVACVSASLHNSSYRLFIFECYHWNIFRIIVSKLNIFVLIVDCFVNASRSCSRFLFTADVSQNLCIIEIDLLDFLCCFSSWLWLICLWAGMRIYRQHRMLRTVMCAYSMCAAYVCASCICIVCVCVQSVRARNVSMWVCVLYVQCVYAVCVGTMCVCACAVRVYVCSVFVFVCAVCVRVCAICVYVSVIALMTRRNF